MSTAHLIQTIIEVIVVVGVIVAVFHEPAIAEWERKQGEKMLKAFKERKAYRK
jgi:hypothetical protein